MSHNIDYNHKVLQVKNLKQHFHVGVGSRKMVIKAVDGISFDIHKREIFGLVGESGCGKTTTGRSIIRIYTPTDGQVIYNGRVVGAGLQGHRERIKEARRQRNYEIAQHQPLQKKILELNEEADLKIRHIEHDIKEVEQKLLLDIDEINDLINKSTNDFEIAKHRYHTKLHNAQQAKKEEIDCLLEHDLRDIIRLYNRALKTNKIKLKEKCDFIKSIPEDEEIIAKKLQDEEILYHENIELTINKALNDIKCISAESYEELYDEIKEGKPVRFKSKVRKRDPEIASQLQAINERYDEIFENLLVEYEAEMTKLNEVKPDASVKRQKIKELRQEAKIITTNLKRDIKNIKDEVKQKARDLRKHAKENPELYVENSEEIAKIREKYAEIIAEEREELKRSKAYNKLTETPEEKAERLSKLRHLKQEYRQKMSEATTPEERELEKIAYKAQVKEIKNAIPNYANTMSKMQMVFQDPIASLNPRMIVRDIISEGLIVRGDRNREEINEKVNRILEIVGLSPDHATRYPHEFSGGQRQRIGIARALIVEPDFIIADEPISALDVSIQAQIINLLNDLKDELGLTILFIAHDLSVVKYFCHTIAVMYYGKIVEMAKADELFAHPIHPYTKALLSAIPQPDPDYEETRERKIYNPAMHNYIVDKPELVEIRPDHFVYANKEEVKQYRQELGLSEE